MKVFLLLITTALLLVNSGALPKAHSNINYVTRIPDPKSVTSWQKDGRIIGGINASISDFPHQVSVRSFWRHFCGGSIISPKWVLTAAHCLYDWGTGPVEFDEIYIRAGSTDQSPSGAIYNVAKYVLHPEWNTGRKRNVALIQIKKSFDCKYCTPIQMTTVWGELEAGKKVNVTGWGYTNTDVAGIAPILQRIEIPIIEREICNNKLAGLMEDDMLCAGERGLDTCFGDDGGPITWHGILFGIVTSMGRLRECHNTVDITAFTNIANENIRNFIATTTGI